MSHLPPEQFAYSLLTRSQRISHENLRLRDKGYIERYEDWMAERAGVTRSPGQAPIPPMFTPFTLRGLTLKNRVVVSPMAQYSCVDGLPADYHLVHLGARAMGGAGLVFAEMTCPSPDARITPGCPGLWNDRAARRLEAHRRLRARATATRRSPPARPRRRQGLDTRAWDGIDLPLPDGPSGNWP
jgi:anthraniloyl-CoA monooxygenase